jgi:hypothetical protein
MTESSEGSRVSAQIVSEYRVRNVTLFASGILKLRSFLMPPSSWVMGAEWGGSLDI